MGDLPPMAGPPPGSPPTSIAPPATLRLAVAGDVAMPTVVADTGPDWWCTCDDADGPHVHCPWGGMHIQLVDIDAELSQVIAMSHVFKYITPLICGNMRKVQ